MKLDSIKIKLIMAENELTHADLAEKLGVDRTWVSHLISGKRACRPVTAGRIAKALGVPVSEIVAEVL